jgi:hypothetical protein
MLGLLVVEGSGRVDIVNAGGCHLRQSTLARASSGVRWEVRVEEDAQRRESMNWQPSLCDGGRGRGLSGKQIRGSWGVAVETFT